jgi:selenium-binding protein 1
VLSRWDKKDEGSEEYLRAYNWDGKELTPAFDIDFIAEKIGKPHLMRFGSASLYN